MSNTIENYNMSSIFKPEVGDMFFAYMESADMSIQYLCYYKNGYQFSGSNIGNAALFNSKEEMEHIPFNNVWFSSAKSVDNAKIFQVKDIFEPHYIIRINGKTIELSINWNIKEDSIIEKTVKSDKGGNLHITNDFELAQRILREAKVDRLDTINKEYLKLKEIKFENVLK